MIQMRLQSSLESSEQENIVFSETFYAVYRTTSDLFVHTMKLPQELNNMWEAYRNVIHKNWLRDQTRKKIFAEAYQLA